MPIQAIFSPPTIGGGPKIWTKPKPFGHQMLTNDAIQNTVWLQNGKKKLSQIKEASSGLDGGMLERFSVFMKMPSLVFL